MTSRLRGLALLLVLPVLAACSSGSGETSAPPPASPSTGATPSATPASTPPKATGVHVTKAQLAAAEPCGFVDTRLLSTYGKATVTPQRGFVGCDFSAAGKNANDLSGVVELEIGLSGTKPGEPPQTARTIDGVAVYAQWTSDRDLCLRDIVAMPGAVLSVYASWSTPPAGDPCAGADAITRSVVRALAEGRTKPANWPASSLAQRDACKLLTAAEAARVPGSDRSKHPAFAGHGCTWGGEDVKLPSVYVSLSREEPPSSGPAVTLEGRRARLDPKPRDEYANLIGPSLPNCSAAVNYQPLRPAHGNWVETLTVVVAADTDNSTSLCNLAKDFARAALRRVPAA
ncbi:DUF3558 family protein [Kribbella sp. DT2]|uniref:DUF3558 family protein n=1 Tax=Kribbella sp. DT2 TaxID=3393427 RepID=UPI003CE9F38A